MPAIQGRLIREVCVCAVCMNEDNESLVYINADTRDPSKKCRIYTTWTDDTANVRCVDYIITSDGQTIDAKDFIRHSVYGLYSDGHVIIDIAPEDIENLEMPIDISMLM